jgi:hypothetical protein
LFAHHDQVLARRRGKRPGATIKYLRRSTSAAAGNGMSITINSYLRVAASISLGTTTKYLQGAKGIVDIGLGTAFKYPRRKTSGAAFNGQGSKIKYLRRTTSAAANNGRAQWPSSCDAQ